MKVCTYGADIGFMLASSNCHVPYTKGLTRGDGDLLTRDEDGTIVIPQILQMNQTTHVCQPTTNEP